MRDTANFLGTRVDKIKAPRRSVAPTEVINCKSTSIGARLAISLAL